MSCACTTAGAGVSLWRARGLDAQPRREKAALHQQVGGLQAQLTRGGAFQQKNELVQTEVQTEVQTKTTASESAGWTVDPRAVG